MWSYLHAKIDYGYISIVEFVQLISFSKVKLLKPRINKCFRKIT